MNQITAQVYMAKDYKLAVAEKERTGAIMTREVRAGLGPVYVVRYLPESVKEL